MAQKKNEDEPTTSEVPLVDDWVAENYDALVADENRGLSYKNVADNAEAQGDKALAAWARKRAANKGKDVTPTTADDKAPATVTRSEVQDDGSRVDVEVPTVTPEDAAAAAAPVPAPPKSGK